MFGETVESPCHLVTWVLCKNISESLMLNAAEASISLAFHSLLIYDQKGCEPGALEEEDDKNANGGIHTEGSEGRQWGGGSNTKSYEVCDRGDGDSHPSMGHAAAYPLHHGQGFLLLRESVPALHYHKHVIYAYAKHQKGDHNMGRAEEI